MISYGELIVDQVVATSPAKFDADRLVRDALYYRLLCVSEAVRSITTLDPAIDVRNAAIDWPAVRAIGNVLRHEYDGVDTLTIWEIVSRGQLQALIDVARNEIRRLDG